MIRRAGALRAIARSLLVVTGGIVMFAFGLNSCAKHPTRVDPAYVPEGVFSPDARLVLWYDGSNRVYRYHDGSPPGPDVGLDPACPVIAPGDSDVLLDSSEVRRYSPGTVLGMIFDATQASGYQVLRREPGAGFQQLNDYSIPPQERWPQSQWELYTFVDNAPSSSPLSSYLGRGVLGGSVGTRSPLTNVVDLGPTPVADIRYTGLACPRDSNFTLRWDPVAGASQYWMQIYTLRAAPVAEEMLSGAPAPLYDGLTHDFFIALLDGQATTYRLGDTTRTDVKILLKRQTLYNTAYSVRISAIDAGGRLIACTRGSLTARRGEGTYVLYRLGAVVVIPTKGR